MQSQPSISPKVLFIIIILAVIFFVSGLLHLLIRFLLKKSPSSPRSPRGPLAPPPAPPSPLQRQLQQLFHLHDSGLDQASIDSLPVFLYREILNVDSNNDPFFDCAVCLCEFSREDRLRLLPACGHAFHLDCIDTWLLTNSTCPLCRAALVSGNDNNSPVLDLDRDDILSVRLGKFRKDEEESSTSTSSRSIDARRCYSMGSYRYILEDTDIQVMTSGGGGGRRVARRGESLSVSKIWLWKNTAAVSPVTWINARRSVGDV